MGVGVCEIQINEITFEMMKKRASSIHYLYKKEQHSVFSLTSNVTKIGRNCLEK